VNKRTFRKADEMEGGRKLNGASGTFSSQLYALRVCKFIHSFDIWRWWWWCCWPAPCCVFLLLQGPASFHEQRLFYIKCGNINEYNGRSAVFNELSHIHYIREKEIYKEW